MQQNTNPLDQLSIQARRSATDVQQLLATNPAPSPQQIIQLYRFSNAKLQILGQSAASWGELVTLAASGRNNTDILNLARLTPVAPTVAQIIALERFSNANLQILGQLAANVGELDRTYFNRRYLGSLGSKHCEMSPSINQVVPFQVW
jgi:hypothetical protein